MEDTKSLVSLPEGEKRREKLRGKNARTKTMDGGRWENDTRKRRVMERGGRTAPVVREFRSS